MKFLFVSASFCLRLPSDSTSRWTPLPSANSSYCQACSGLSPPSYRPCWAHNKKTFVSERLSLKVFKLKYFYIVLLSSNATHSTWDELIELINLRFFVKWSYVGTYRLICTFVGTCRYVFIPYLVAPINILAYQVLSNHLLDLFLDVFLKGGVLKYKAPLTHLLI